MKNIYAIVVTFNGIDWIEKCLNSLINSTLVSKIIIIDNGSTDSTITIIKQNFKTVTLIESKINLGFGQANNIGLKLALENHCDYAFLLNQDAWLQNKHTLLNLVTAFEINPNLGILSPLHLNGQGTALDLYFADYLQQSDIGNTTAAQILTQKQPNLIINTTFVNAAAWLISAACFKKIGGFDPVFFHYGEDRNYTHRTLYYGFKIGICPQAIILHDREQRLVPINATPILNLKTDWVNDLNLFCDIHQKSYKTLILKRIIRHFVLMLVSISNPRKFKYHYQMLKNIVSFLNKIERSRKISLKKLSMAHL